MKQKNKTTSIKASDLNEELVNKYHLFEEIVSGGNVHYLSNEDVIEVLEDAIHTIKKWKTRTPENNLSYDELVDLYCAEEQQQINEEFKL